MLKFRFQATTRKPDGQLDKPYLNGATPRLGRLLGVTTPVNDAVVGIIRLANAGCSHQWSRNKLRDNKIPRRGRGCITIAYRGS